MRARTLVAALTAATLVSTTRQADAQIRMGRPGASYPRIARADDAPDQPRGGSTALGLSLTTTGTDRDTLGMLISDVSRGSPADRAGIDVGSRVAAFNDVSLRIDPADVGDHDAQQRLQRKLALALRSLRSGDDVTLRVFSGGQYRVLSLHTGDDAATVASSDDAPPIEGRGLRGALPPEPAPDLAGEADRPPVPRRPAPASVETVLRALADAQAQLRQLEDAGDSGPLLDSLMRAERDVLSAQHRLRSAGAPRRAPATESDEGSIGSIGMAPRRRTITTDNGSIGSANRGDILSVPGLRLAPVSQGLTSYFGEGSDRGLLVMSADASWSPIHVGDVILRVDDAPVDASALRAAADPQRQVSVDLLRRRRLLTVTLHSDEE